MKIVLEEVDVIGIISEHIKNSNLLNLGDKEFQIETNVEGVTFEVVTTLVDDKKPKIRRKRATVQAKPKVIEPTQEEPVPEPELEPEEEQVTTQTSSDDEKPPFAVDEPEENKPAVVAKSSKSLFA